jgi:hypothetical protein
MIGLEDDRNTIGNEQGCAAECVVGEIMLLWKEYCCEGEAVRHFVS